MPGRWNCTSPTAASFGSGLPPQLSMDSGLGGKVLGARASVSESSGAAELAAMARDAGVTRTLIYSQFGDLATRGRAEEAVLNLLDSA